MTDKPGVDEEVAQLNWCDVSLCRISWVEDGRDVVLDLLMPPSDRRLQLICRWVRGLQTNLEFQEDTAGYPLSWDGNVSRRDDGAWDVKFDFASTGRLSLVCQDIEVHQE